MMAVTERPGIAPTIPGRKETRRAERQTQDTKKPAEEGGNDVMERRISRFQGIDPAPVGDAAVKAVLDEIRGGNHCELVERVREAGCQGNKVRYAALKKQLPAVTWSGTFRHRDRGSLDRHSGLLCIDLDHVEGMDVIRADIEADPHTLACWLSPGGEGLKILVSIEADRHADAWESYRHYLRDNYGVDVDTACKDLARLCFLSYDPELFLREDAKLFCVQPSENEEGLRFMGYGEGDTLSGSSPLESWPSRDDIRALLARIPSRPDYNDWIKIVAAVGDALPYDEAIAELIAWSPEEHAGEYSEKLKARLRDVGIGTLYWYAQQYETAASFDATESSPMMPAGIREEDSLRFISLREILAADEEDEAFLLEDMIPAVGVSAVVGIPDSGKSLFTRHLALSIATTDEFVGMRVTTRYRRAVLVVTEESIGQVRCSIRKQLDRIASVPLDAIDILPANAATPGEVVAALEAKLMQSPADLVVVDSYGDMFPGQDPNNPAQTRRALKPFDGLAQRFGIAVLFVHHLNKASYRLAPDHSQVSNSAAFVQKCRSVLDLRYEAHDPLIKYLSVTKGNGVSVTVKQHARVLRFDEETLTYSFTGDFKPVSQINAGVEDEAKAATMAEARKLKREGVSVRDIADRLNVSKSTAGEWTKGIKENGVRVECPAPGQ